MLKQAENQKAAGTGTGIEITRARVQLANDRQRLLVAENARRARESATAARDGPAAGYANLVLTDKLEYVPVDAVTLEQAQGAGVDSAARSARRSRSAKRTRGSRRAPPNWSGCPRWRHSATTDRAAPGSTTRCPRGPYGVSVRVPIFDGGRRDARRAESASQYRPEQVRTNDLKEQIELDVRLALDALRSAEEQVKVAQEGLELAENELAQARRRYDAGVADGPGSDRRADAAGARARQPDGRALQLQRGAHRPGAGDGRGPRACVRVSG